MGDLSRMAPTKGFGASPLRRRAACAVTLCAAVLLTGCDYLRPFEQVCEQRLGPVSIRVDAPATQHVHDYTQSTSNLTARGTHAGAGRRVEGLTEVNLISRIAIGGNGVVKPFSGRYCTRPDVQVTLAYKPMTVFIASEQKAGSCMFDLTMGHEMKHVRSYERFIDELAGEVETGLKTALTEKVHYFPNAAEGERVLNALISEKVNAAIRDGLAVVQKRQAAIDTPEEYGRLDLMSSKCGT